MCGVVVSLVSISWRESVVNSQDTKYHRTLIIGSVSDKYGIIPQCQSGVAIMGEDYTYDDYESICELYDMGEVYDTNYADDDYDQVGHYEQLADRYCAWLSVDNWQSLCYNEGVNPSWSVLVCWQLYPPFVDAFVPAMGVYNFKGPSKL